MTVESLLLARRHRHADDIRRLVDAQDPKTYARKPPLASRIAVVDALLSANARASMTPETFEQTLVDITGGKVQVDGDCLQLARYEALDLLEIWRASLR